MNPPQIDDKFKFVPLTLRRACVGLQGNLDPHEVARRVSDNTLHILRVYRTELMDSPARYAVDYHLGAVYNLLTGTRIHGCLTSKKYVQVRINLRSWRLHVLLMESKLGRVLDTDNGKEVVDHWNGVKDDNRGCNLRVVSSRDNTRANVKMRQSETADERYQRLKLSVTKQNNELLKALPPPRIPTLATIIASPNKFPTLWANGKEHALPNVRLYADLEECTIVRVNSRFNVKVTVSRGYANEDGYLAFRIGTGTKLVHRLMMQSFLRRDLLTSEQIDHTGDNKFDNRLAHLKIVDRVENIRRAQYKISTEERRTKAEAHSISVKRHNKDGSFTIFRSMGEAGASVGVIAGSIKTALDKKAFCAGFRWYDCNESLALLPYDEELRRYKEFLRSRRSAAATGGGVMVSRMNSDGSSTLFPTVSKAAKTTAMTDKQFGKAIDKGKNVDGFIWKKMYRIGEATDRKRKRAPDS